MSWPAWNASFNALSALCLVCGFVAIRSNRVHWHRALMGTALLFSTIFVISYLMYHYRAGSVPYQGQGLLRIVYFSILITHSILAAVIVPLILRTLYLAVKGRFDIHYRWARWTLPMWFYVSVTGVVIYAMLYA